MQEICSDIKDINLNVMGNMYRTDILSMLAMCKFAHEARRVYHQLLLCRRAYGIRSCLIPSTKGAIVTFTQSLAQQQAPNGIALMLLRPA